MLVQRCHEVARSGRWGRHGRRIVVPLEAFQQLGQAVAGGDVEVFKLEQRRRRALVGEGAGGSKDAGDVDAGGIGVKRCGERAVGVFE